MRNEIESFYFNEATVTLYDFIWSEFCDWYIETSKIALYSGNKDLKENKASVLFFLLNNILKMLHPFMPFITEKIYQFLPVKEKDSIMITSFPVVMKNYIFEEDEANFEFLKEIVYSIRNLRGEYNISPSVSINVVLKIEDDVKKSFLEKNETCIKKLAKVNNLSFVKEYRKSAEESIYVGSGFEIYARVAELINIEKEKEKIQKEIERLTKQIENISAKLSNPSFLEKAPLEVIEREQKKLDDWTEELKKLKSSLSELTGKSL